MSVSEVPEVVCCGCGSELCGHCLRQWDRWGGKAPAGSVEADMRMACRGGVCRDFLAEK